MAFYIYLLCQYYSCFWLLWLSSMLWNQKVWDFQLCSSFIWFFFFFFAIWDPLKLHMNLSVGFLYQKRKNKLKLKLQYFVSWWEELTWKRPWYWERLKARERDDRGWGGWMASPTQWTWAWASPRSWWWTGRPGVLQSIGLQRVGHDWVTKLTES